VQNGAPYDPTADTVQMAFLADGIDPLTGDWKNAAWETTLATGGATLYLARTLVGPAGVITLAKGHYRVWVKIQDNPEIPVLTSDILIVS
jgi:hypothetical protein